MTNSEEQALLNLAMHAAMADGGASSDERNALEKLCQDYHQLGVPMPSADAAVRAGMVKELAAKFKGSAYAKLAFEACVVVCDSDGNQGPEEKAFLDGLKQDLGLDAPVAQAVQAVLQSVVVPPAVAAPVAGVSVPTPAATTPLPGFPLPAVAPLLKPILAQVGAPVAPVTAKPPATARDLEPLILDRALLTGALDKIPEGYATMAVGQTQIRMVDAIARAMGQPSDRDQASAFIASLGIGQAAQAVEGFFAKALKGLLGKGTPPPSAYATTYALGRTACQNFVKPGAIATADLKERFELFRQRGQALLVENEAAIRQLATQITVTNLPGMIRGPLA